MEKLTIRCLIISGLLFALTSCQSYQLADVISQEPTEREIVNPYFSTLETDYTYRAHVEIYGRELSGLFIVKRMDSVTHRMVLTTDFGNTLVDLTIGNHVFKINYVMEELDRKMVLDMLHEDFKTLLSPHQHAVVHHALVTQDAYQVKEKSNTYYLMDKESGYLSKIVKASKRKEQVVYEFETSNGKTADQIDITHKTIRLKISLTKTVL